MTLEPLNDEQMEALRAFAEEVEAARKEEVEMRWDMAVIIALSSFTLGFVLGPGVLW